MGPIDLHSIQGKNTME